MILYPAIDLKEGQVVRLQQGDMARATVFHADPVAQAEIFAQQGFSHLHIVDLDGAFAGESRNGAAVAAIAAQNTAKIQLGGGIRTMAMIEHWLERGIDRVILGTAALRDPQLVKDACAKWAGRVSVGIDARDGKVAVEGWAETSAMSVLELAKQFEGVGVASLIYTDIARDGVLGGVNRAATVALADAVSIPIVASGGLADLADLQALLAEASRGIAGVIAGRALYDGRLVARDALALAGVV